MKQLRTLIAAALLAACAQVAGAQTTAAVVETWSPTNVTYDSAVLLGNCTNIGSGTTYVYFAWGTNDGDTTIGSWENSEYADTLTYARDYYLVLYQDLSATQTYYARTWASNNAGVSWATQTVSWTTESSTPTNYTAIEYVTVICDTNGTLVWPTNFFIQNGITPTTEWDSVIARVDAGTNTTANYAVPATRGANVLINGDFTNGDDWVFGSAAWSSSGSNVLVNAGDAGTLTPSSQVAIAAGMTVWCQYSNSLASTGSVVFRIGNWTNTSTYTGPGAVTFLAHLQSASNPVITVHATNGQTSIDSIHVEQVLDGDGHFADDVTVGGMLSAYALQGNGALVSNANAVSLLGQTWTTAHEMGTTAGVHVARSIQIENGQISVTNDSANFGVTIMPEESGGNPYRQMIGMHDAYLGQYLDDDPWSSENTKTNQILFGGDQQRKVYFFGVDGLMTFLMQDSAGVINTTVFPNIKLTHTDAALATNGPWWIHSTYAPSNSSATARNYTFSVNDTNFFVCFTNGFFGAGTNWMRGTLEAF